MKPIDDPRNEGHTREWQDRARVVLDAKEAAKTEASPNQSPHPEEEVEKVKERREEARDSNENDEPVY